MISLLFVALSVLRAVCAQTNSTNVTLSSVSSAFSSASIVPDVLPSFNPTAILEVVFLDQATNTSINVTPGMNLTMEQTTLEPQFFLVSNNTALTNDTFVLAIVDPDAPTPQNATEAQFRHLLAGDLHVNSSLSNMALLVNSSAALTEFVMPTPPAGSDPHRYVILLFVQPSDFDSVAPSFVNSSTVRNNFNITAFAAEVGLGSPIAGNFFLTGPTANATNSTSSTSPSSSAPAPSATAPSSGASHTSGISLAAIQMSIFVGVVIMGIEAAQW